MSRGAIALVLLGLLSPVVSAAPDFARDVLPIFQKHCYPCHGPEEQTSGFRLDVRDVAYRGGDFGEPAIVPHDAANSPLIRYVSGDDEIMVMPPEDSGLPRLTPEQVSTLRQWIDAGPAWPDEFAGAATETKLHWSLRPLSRPEVPVGANHPIDAFVRSKLVSADMRQSKETDRRTLIRRITYDLTGLAPTTEEVASFVADGDPEAYAKLVERLLASPRYGEHWARHWLDVAHYADTHGNDHDYARFNAWPYRDYVIRAFNDDKPYSRFVEEQVAGDALFPDDPSAVPALGFLAAGPWDETLMVVVREDTYDHHLAQMLDRDDMVTTVMNTFQSQTVHCARCHNHKFDPIAQRDYYALQAVFAGIDRADRPFDSDPQTYTQRRDLLARKAAIAQRAPPVMASLHGADMQRRLATAAESLAARPTKWKPLDVLTIENEGDARTTFTRQPDGSWLVGGELPKKDTFLVTAKLGDSDVRALRIEALPDDSLPGRGPGRYHPTGNFHLAEFHVDARPATAEKDATSRVQFSRATADHSDGGDIVANAIDGRPDTHWSVHPRYGEPHEAVFELKEPLGHEDGTTLIIRLVQSDVVEHQLGRFRLTYCTNELPVDERPAIPARIAQLLSRSQSERTAEEHEELALHVLTAEIDRELSKLPPPQIVYAVTNDFAPMGNFKPAYSPRPIHLLTRGDLNKPAELVEPGTLTCLPEISGKLEIADVNDESARRAALARWLTDQHNVLTWRSIVNRVWHYHFGRGLCDSPNDFGKMGGTPSHPELLDWLAVWFRDDAKGSLKALHRLIVTSDTYRQCSSHDVEAAGIDADNRLLWRMNRVRLTAEEIRDTMLQLSNQLDLTMGGPAVVQFVHRDKATFTPDGGAPAFLDYENFSPDAPENRRRAIYRFVFRTVPDPLMDALDAPDGGALTPVRSVSTTALQAFALLNNAFVIRQCEHIAARIAADAKTPTEQTVAAFELMLQRPPHASELAHFSAYISEHGLANACQVIVNSNEFVYLD